ncbi:MAG: YbjN domain-containing protein [Treponema sp.]|nr:YbjN domain-containing protein [Treponema sp.]
MTKIGKIVLAVLVLGGICIFSAAAQEEWTREGLQDIYMEHLTVEGYRPEVDPDGDIQFRVLGSNYFIIVDEGDLKFFQIYTGFWLDEMSMEDAYELVNIANRRSKVAKVSLSYSPEEPERLIVSITAELLLNSPKDFSVVFPRALSLLANAKSIFQAQLAKL